MRAIKGRPLERMPILAAKAAEGIIIRKETDGGADYVEYLDRYERRVAGKLNGVPAVVYKNANKVENYPNGRATSVVGFAEGNPINIPHVEISRDDCSIYTYTDEGILSRMGGPAYVLRGMDISVDAYLIGGILNNPFGPTIVAKQRGESLIMYHFSGRAHRNDGYAVSYESRDLAFRIYYSRGEIHYVNKDTPSVWIRRGETIYQYWLQQGNMYIPMVQNRVCLATLRFRNYNCVVIKNGKRTEKLLFPAGPEGKQIFFNPPLLDKVREGISLPRFGFRYLQHNPLGPYKWSDGAERYALMGLKYNERYFAAVQFHGDIPTAAKKAYFHDRERIFGNGVRSLEKFSRGEQMPRPVVAPADWYRRINPKIGSCFGSLQSGLPAPSHGEEPRIPGSLTNFHGGLEPQFGNYLVVAAGKDLPDPAPPIIVVCEESGRSLVKKHKIAVQTPEGDSSRIQYFGNSQPTITEVPEKIRLISGIPIGAMAVKAGKLDFIPQ